MKNRFGFSIQDAYVKEQAYSKSVQNAEACVSLCLRCNKAWEPLTHSCETRGLVANLHLDEQYDQNEHTYA